MLKRLLFSLLLSSLFVPHSSFADTNIKLLPPSESNSNPTDDSTKDYSVCSSNVTGKVLTWDGQHPIKCSSQVFIDNNGKVGIGTSTPQTTLDVQGDIRTGNTGTACTSANKGATHYNSTTNTMEFCNGTAWGDFAPPGTSCGAVFYQSVDHTGDASDTYWADGPYGAKCKGNAILSNGFAHDNYGTPTAPNCPSGYSYLGFMVFWVSNFPGSPCDYGGGSPLCNVRYHLGSCYKK